MPDDPLPGGPDSPATPGPVQCPICEDELDDEQALAEHMEQEHG
ncbi:MAG: C2H2-type zinc finger protein [Candidatus Nanohaloarchaea archaeon]|nr:C2H2-type zinc finger protein [Candidatus Nanohaloarchaea archaeon]